MKHRIGIVSGLLILGLIFIAQVGMADQSSRYARIRYIEGDVVLYPSDGQRPSDASVNSPVLDGDEIESQNGRAEISFRNGIIVRMGDYSAVRFESTYSPMTMELLRGTLFVDSHTVSRFGDELEIQAGDAQVYLINEGNLRIDLGNEGGVRVTTLDGEAEVRAAGTRVLLEKEQRTYVDPGNAPAHPEAFARNYDEMDDWNQDRIDAYADMGNGGEQHVQDSLYYDTQELGNYGDWRTYGTYGNVWVPNVYAGWRPYYDGRWAYGNDSWFWVSNEPWGWAPYHYGRWDWALGIGWFWIPGYTFAPAWVSWYDYGDYIGWCPLNYHNYPVYYYDHGHYYPPVQKQNTLGVGDSWTFVRKAALGDPNIKRISVSTPEIKSLKIDRTQLLKQPEKGLSTFVAGRGTKTAPSAMQRKSPSIFTQRPADSGNTGSGATKSFWGDRSSDARRTAPSDSGSGRSTISTQRPDSTGKGSSGSSGTSVNKAAPSSKKSSGSSSSSKKPAPPNYNRDDQFEKYLPSNSSYGSRLSRDTVSPTSRDRQFGTWSYRDRQSRDYGSPKTYRDSRNNDNLLPWFRNSRSYEEPGPTGSREVSPRYMEGAKKVFEGFEASRNAGSSRESGGTSVGSRDRSNQGYGGGSPKSQGYGGGSSKSNSGGSVKSYGSPAKSAPSASSAKKPH